jgi:hypothetical protein
LLDEDRSYLTEIFFEKAEIEHIRKGDNVVNVKSKNIFILENESNRFRDVILAPIKCPNTIRHNELHTNNKYKVNMNINVLMHQNGDKSIQWTIEGIKLFVKPFIFTKVLSFFTEAFPNYDNSEAKPNGYYNSNGKAIKDPNNKITFIIDIQKSLLLFTHDIRHEKLAVCEGHFHFNYHRENYVECREMLQRQYDKECNKEKAMNSFVSVDGFEPDIDIQMPVASITFNILNACFRVCKTNHIKDKKK